MYNLGEKQELSGHANRSESFPNASSLPWQTAAGESLCCNAITLFPKMLALTSLTLHSQSHCKPLSEAVHIPTGGHSMWKNSGMIHEVLQEMPRGDWAMQNCLRNCLVEALCSVLHSVAQGIRPHHCSDTSGFQLKEKDTSAHIQPTSRSTHCLS